MFILNVYVKENYWLCMLRYMWYNFILYGDGFVCLMLFYILLKFWYFIDVKGYVLWFYF